MLKYFIVLLGALTPLFPYELAIAALFRDEAPYLEEWIEYHLLVGADHFWLYNDTSRDGWQEALAPYIERGLVEVFEWDIPDILFYSTFQVAAYEDALKRGQKNGTKWIAFIDIDEFLLPVEERTVTECLERRFANAAAVLVNWRNFGTGGLYLEKGEPILPRLTACSEELHSRNAQGKSIVQPHLIDETDVCSPHSFIPKEGRCYYNGDGEPIEREGKELLLNGEHHRDYLILNHYFTRDENFYQNVRLMRQKAFGVEPELTAELYEDFNKEEDFKLIEFVKERHPEWAKTHWDKEVPTVSARIYGRLGNNLFQVAAASALAWDNGAKAIFPDFPPFSETFRHVFFRCDNRPRRSNSSFVWNEPSYSYAPIPYHPNMEIVGYFQSEGHFAHHRERIVALFAPHPKDLAYIRKKFYWLEDCLETVGVQLRYYKREFPTESMYPQYGKDYLAKAVGHFSPDALFIVSSDNLDFAKECMPDWAEKVVFLEGEPAYIDFYLLSLCKHNIISNSSFGWWSAWLNQNPEKKVVCPALWMTGCPASVVCPKTWIQVEAGYD